MRCGMNLSSKVGWKGLTSPAGSAPRRARSMAGSCRKCHPGDAQTRLIRRSSSTQSSRFPTNDHHRSDGISCAPTYGSVAYAGVGCRCASHPHQKEFGVITTDTTEAIPPVGEPDDDLIQLLTPEGERVHHEAYTPRIDDLDRAALEGFYRDMVLVRRFDTEATSLQRHGELGLWPPCLGQEAAQIGSGRALARQDYVFPSYRELGVAWTRGVDLLKEIGRASCRRRGVASRVRR